MSSEPQGRREYRLVREPKGRVYRGLLNVVPEYCPEFLLVQREQLKLGPAGVALLRALHPYRVHHERRSTWPGTELIGHFAHVHRFRAEGGAIQILKDAVSSLYAWLTPLPEDLCFLRADGDALLTTIAHEREGWMNLSDDERTDLARVLGAGALRRAG